ncbi:MAG: SPFH domain-containing protein [Planctomycetales bacterium]|nr:SPFH domain-containing protein [Planctomycetales bacterium]
MIRLEVIDFLDQTGQALVARVPESGTAAIQAGAQLIVQQNQEAVFFRDGRAMDSFGPGRHTLTTANIPILTKILTIPWERSPFQACVYFVGKHRYIDQRWGTRSPITMRDPDFGMVRLRGFGKYSFRVADASLLIGEIVGTQGKFTSEEISGYLRDVVVSGLADLLATANVGLLNMAQKFEELAAAARVKLGEQFKKYGLELTDFMINSISPPEEVQRAIDARSSMAAIGDLRSYTLYQAANGIGQATGAGGNAAQLGLGAGMGMMLPQMLQQALQPSTNDNTSSAAAKAIDFSSLSSGKPGVQQALRDIASKSNWHLVESGSLWTLTVPTGTLRKQYVKVTFDGKDDAGHAVVNISSSCGAINPASALALLRFNSQLVHGAFAVRQFDDGEQLVLNANLLADTADSLELVRTVTSIAWQADQYEQQLHGADDR